jgi:hypothetical protein
LPSPDLRAIHRANNRLTAGDWDRYGPHRARLGALIDEAAPSPGGRLCVLGAGNANDLDLGALAGRFAEIHLVDLDADALARAVARQAHATRRRLWAHTPVDVSGLLAELPRWRRAGIAPPALARAAHEAAAAAMHALPGPFDLVVSDCLLSQLYWTCFSALGVGPRLAAVTSAALDAHAAALAASIAPGGRGLLVTDTISSETFPLEEIFPERDPGALLAELVRREVLFSGTSPALVLSALRRCGSVEAPRLSSPWLWPMNARLTVMVYAVAFARKRAA